MTALPLPSKAAKGFNQTMDSPRALSPDGTLLVFNTSEGPRFMDLLTRQLGPVIRFVTTVDNGFQLVRFSPNNRWVLLQLHLTTALFDARRMLDTPPPADNGSIMVGNRSVPRAPVLHPDPIWSRDAGSLFWNDADFSASSELISILNATGTDDNVSLSICETRTGKTLATLPINLQRMTAVRFVPGKPMLTTADRAGTVLLWDLKSLINNGKPRTGENASDDQLWASLADPDAGIAYRAGFRLIDHHQLASRAAGLKPIASTNARSKSDQIHDLIGQLSSQTPADREKAHKTLEGIGPAAIPAVRDALNAHPGGELEDRLTSIAKVIGADDPTTPIPPSVSNTAPVDDAQTLRTARVVQLLEWCNDPASKSEHDRLLALPALQ